ncbi:phosphatidate cytidylyltransferase [Microlunatus sp. Gsoil 973]|uniref:phosphatidate cytidylyltransferase n=1 Tax=Microlunatus sp. Gsoil 973 TaxID=2672569 RepID=UPI001E2E8863|nr:phosphatidate cytidylyltransferase [Microlunatus sp. Gsoil 973]
MAAEADSPDDPEDSPQMQHRPPPRPGGDLPIWSTDRPPVDYGRVGRDLRAAIITGVLLGGAIVASLIFFKFGFILIMAALLVLATVELGHNFARRNIKVAAVPVAVGTGLAVIVPYLAEYIPSLDGNGLGRNAVLVGLLALTSIAALAWRMRGGSQGFLVDASASLFLIAYVPLLGSFASLLLAGDRGIARVVTFILVVVCSDLGGYVAGVLFGRHPMAPVISPKKSWEGFVGSMVFATAAAVLMAVLGLKVDWWVGLVLGPLLVLVATVGDLVESLIKRDLGIKDMSSFLPGHGGVMDRLDSLLLAAPMAWLIMYLLVPGG